MSLPTGATRPRVSRVRPESRARARLAVVPPRPATARSGPFVLLVATILVVGLVGLLMLNLSMQKASFRLAALQDRAEALQTREQSLDLRVDRLASSRRLLDEATRLGMVPNPNPVFLDLSDGSVIGDPAVALPRAEPVDPLDEVSSNATDEDKPAADDGHTGTEDDEHSTENVHAGTGDGHAGTGDDRPRTEDDHTGTADDRPRSEDGGTATGGGEPSPEDGGEAESGATPRGGQPDSTGRDR